VDGLRARVNQIEHELDDRPRTYLSVITDLGDRRYTLLSDVTITLEEYKDEVVARWSDVGVYASGTTESEAIAGIKRQIVELFEELRTMKPGTLGRMPLSWKRILRRAIKVNAQVPYTAVSSQYTVDRALGAQVKRQKPKVKTGDGRLWICDWAGD
jgi:hypothetical protein